jgi:molecular chaperone GrpE (heat shock protein)
MNKLVQDLKMEAETINKSQMKANMEMENLRKRSETIYPSINKQNIREGRETLRHKRCHRRN